ncbi:EsaB/YukD family protein [Paenibacillus sp. S-38]|uniref:EsaB/YukD family protein n=1 Tax=Paenibacillus sp. S-38 TaxID=3416710 RepID=UPI003CE9DF23
MNRIMTLLRERLDVDVEVPDDMPVGRLLPLLAEAAGAAVHDGGRLILEASLPGEAWRILPPERTLSDEDIRDGAFLRIGRMSAPPEDKSGPGKAESASGDSSGLPVAGWKPLFS